MDADSRFPALLRELRQQCGLSLRNLARQVNYSHTYLWELEVGRKQPAHAVAVALDTALGGDGQLAALVAEVAVVVPAPRPPALPEQLGDLRNQLAHAAQVVAGAPRSVAAAEWAQLASWLYDTFVRRRPRFVRLGPQRYSRSARMQTGLTPFRLEASRQSRQPSTECRSVTRAPAPAMVAQRLSVDEDQAVIRRENWYFTDGEPVQAGITYVPIDVAKSSPVASMKRLGTGGLYGQLEDRGYPMHRMREEVHARMPAPEEAAALRLPPGVPVLEIVHTSYDSQAYPFEVTHFVLRADLAALDYEINVED